MKPYQRIEFDEYITPEGDTFRLEDLNSYVLSFTGHGMPPIKYLTQRGPFQHGETAYDFRLDPRIIQLVWRREGCNRQSYWDNRAALLNALRPNRQLSGQFNPGRLRKQLPDGSKRDIDVFIESGPVFVPRETDRYDEFGITETLRFIAHDPTFYNPTAVCVPFVISYIQELVFPLTFMCGPAVPGICAWDGLVFAEDFINNTITLTYPGTWLAFPTIVITGPINGPTIYNDTTGEKIQLSYSVSTGEVVTITLQYGNKTVTNAAGVNLIGVVSSDSDLATFHLAPDPEATGGVNTLRVTGGAGLAGTTAVTVSYLIRYIGI